MGFHENKDAGEDNTSKSSPHHHDNTDDEAAAAAAAEDLGRQMSETSLYATEEEEDDEGVLASKIQLGPQCTLKEHLEKDKDDESLRKWKEQLLGSVDINNIGVNLLSTIVFFSH